MEVALGGGLNAVRLRAIEALVQVQLHDLVFAVCLGKLVGESELLDLAAHGLLGSQELLLGELLRDRAATADNPARTEVVVSRADDTGEVDPSVRVKALVFDRDGRLDHHGIDVLQLHGQAVVAVVPHVGEENSVAVGYDRVAGEAGAVQALDRGQAVKEGLRIGVGRKADHEQYRQDRAEAAEHRGAAHLLPNRRPRRVDARSRAMPRLGRDLLRNVSRHVWRPVDSTFSHSPKRRSTPGGYAARLGLNRASSPWRTRRHS